MSRTVLLVGTDLAWHEALTIELAASGWTVSAAHKLPDALASFDAGDAPDAAVLAAFGNPQRNGTEWALIAARALREKWPGLPLLFDMSVPDYALTAFVLNGRPARIGSSTDGGAFRSMLDHLLLPTAGTGCAASVGVIEITCDDDAVTFTARLDNESEPFGPYPVPWTQAQRLHALNEDFRRFQLYTRDGNNRRGLDPACFDRLQRAGADIAATLGLEGAHRAVLADFMDKFGSFDDVHLRFNFRPKWMEHIPFEIIWDTARQKHVRVMLPVARRVLLGRDEMTGRRRSAPEQMSLTGKALFIKAPAWGQFDVIRPHSRDRLRLEVRKLRSLEIEWKALLKARTEAGRDEPVRLALSGTGGRSFDRLVESLRDGPWDIVHFAGHSVSVDDGEEVFLLLPGANGPLPLSVQDFAEYARIGEVRLVILSSCESGTHDAVFRLAQSGVPAAIGFRWEVDDSEAAEFTAALHRALAQGEPIGRAFHTSVQWLKAKFPASPTFASPILLMQDETWAAPKGTRRTEAAYDVAR